jgi:hypothetical protein
MTENGHWLDNFNQQSMMRLPWAIMPEQIADLIFCCTIESGVEICFFDGWNSQNEANPGKFLS